MLLLLWRGGGTTEGGGGGTCYMCTAVADPPVSTNGHAMPCRAVTTENIQHPNPDRQPNKNQIHPNPTTIANYILSLLFVTVKNPYYYYHHRTWEKEEEEEELVIQ